MLLCLGGRSPRVIMYVCVCVLVLLLDSCLHFLHDCWKLKAKTCIASLTQCCLEIECSPRLLLPAIQKPGKNKSLTTGCLSTSQFNLYNKSDGDQSEIQRMRLPKLHNLSFAYHNIPWTACSSRAQIADWLLLLILVLSLPETSNLYIVVSQDSLKTVYVPAIMLLT